MKKFTFFILTVLLAVTVFGQSPRMVLHEEFTSSTCGPCASVNPNFHNWLVQHPDIYTAIYWHCNWPAPSNDPMYFHNPTENGYRIGFYGVSSIPWAVIDGNVFDNVGSALNWNTVQNRANVPSPMEIKLYQQMNAAQDSFFSTMVVKCTQALNAPMVAHNIVIEKHVHFNTAPGTNGEKDFYNVMKKMLPDKNGTTLPAAMAVGDYVVMEGGWKHANVYSTSELASIGFVQNTSTREVYQAGNSSASMITMPYNNDAEVTKISNYPTSNCSGSISPVITVRNNGNSPITSMEIRYQVNNEPEGSYTWNGNLTTLQSARITIPNVTFGVMPENTLRVFTKNPNNTADEYPKNDTLSAVIPQAGILLYNGLLVSIRTDAAPQETTWDVRDQNGTVIDQGGPYAQGSHTYKDTVYVDNSGCYTFTMYDSGHNGICCENGTGFYYIAPVGSPSAILYQGGEFRDSESTQFDVILEGIADRESSALKVVPNPLEGSGKIILDQPVSAPVKAVLFSLPGNVVKTVDYGTVSSGRQELNLDVNGMVPGMYLLQVTTGSSVMTKKITVR